jgi:hypothetical protein
MEWNQKLWRRSVEEFPEFMEPLVAELGRSERREGAAWYVQGLMMPGERKSVEPMAERLGVDSQKLQQFLADSPWDEQRVWEAIRRDVVPVLEPLGAWIIDETGWLKQGDKSVGVAHQYCGAGGRSALFAGKLGQRHGAAGSGRGAARGAISNQAGDRGGLSQPSARRRRESRPRLGR